MKYKKEMDFLVIFLLVSLAFIPMLSSTNTQEEFEMNAYFFWGVGCSHCEKVIDSGILNDVGNLEKVTLSILEVYNNQSSRNLYNLFSDKFNINEFSRGVPFLVVEKVYSSGEKEFTYFFGDTPIINGLNKIFFSGEEFIIENPIKDKSNEENEEPDRNKNVGKITLGSIIIAALIDSVNPCAFGVLIFLLATMLSMSSSKRALKYGLLYTFIIFLVYFSAGLGIMKLIMKFSQVMNIVVVISAILVFIGGVIEIKDFFWYGKGISLKIPDSVKPFLEKVSKKGTVWAVILLGVMVALVELPCTGGIYLAILSLMHVNKTFGAGYLLIYNLIFILPLVAIVLGTYFGTKTQSITNWTEENKKWMRLLAGIVMISLAIYLLNSIYKFI